jgi:hypothetical protein
LPLADLEIARPLEMLREPVLGYLMELLAGMQAALSALCHHQIGRLSQSVVFRNRWSA